jgi:hypothetical protein
MTMGCSPRPHRAGCFSLRAHWFCLDAPRRVTEVGQVSLCRVPVAIMDLLVAHAIECP